MNKQNPIDQVRKLIALAQHPGTCEHEASNAALAAVRLMSSHAIAVIYGADLAVCRASRIVAKAGMCSAKDEGPRRAHTRAPRRNSAVDALGGTWRLYSSRTSGRCGNCGCGVEKGQPVWWTRGQWVRCDAPECTPGGA